ncbi:MAG: thiamine pyrophosphate-binding protein [Acidobacteria bacterium]|nr:thiamine pyrophosphate-binding protein [Acidobacteriota bacterium]MDA1235800.1 thiamine pyrophosphate-binding protein [Acidobacteriota bacterium]
MPNGAELFSQTLKQLGVTHVFALVGDHLNEALQVLDRDGFKIVDTRHESAAVHMADGWARMSGRLAVSLVTGGPGHTNSITGIATAQATGVPLLAVSGQSNSKQRDRNGFQDMDQLGLARSAAKYCASPASASQIPFYVREAYRAATTGRPGAAHLSIAVDHFTDRVEKVAPLIGSVAEHRPGPDRSEVSRVVELLQTAKRPAVIAGSGCFWAGAGQALETFIERAQTPLFTITMARGMVSDEHPLCFGYADPTISRGAEKALQQADVVLVLGKRIDYRLRMGGLFAPDAKVIQVDIHPQELGLNRSLAVGLNCDCRLALEDLNLELADRARPDRSGWLAEVQRGCDEYAAEVDERSHRKSQPMHALEFYRQMREWLPEDATLCWDGGDFVHWGRYVMPARKPGHWMRLGALAGLGVGFPIGLAAQVLRPTQRSIVVTGDGSLGFYLAEMDTAVRFNLPVIIIVGNDGGWGVERELQAGRYDGRTVACELRRTRYDLVMKGFGGDGVHVERPEQIRPALDQALASDKPFLINVEIDGAGSPFTEAQLRPKKN